MTRRSRLKREIEYVLVVPTTVTHKYALKFIFVYKKLRETGLTAGGSREAGFTQPLVDKFALQVV